MAIVHHKIIDAMTGRSPKAAFDVLGATEPDRDRAVKLLTATQGVMENARIFESVSDFDVESTITEDESRMFLEGVIPIPFDTCWIERSTRNDHLVKHCYLVARDPDEPRRIMMQWFLWLTLGDGRNICMSDLSMVSIMTGPFKGDYVNLETSEAFEDPDREVERKAHPFFGSRTPSYATFNEVAITCIMLCSRTTEVVKVEAPERLNAKRAKNGKTPLKSHYVIDVIPREVRVRMKADDESGRSKEPSHVRLHWRRSHKRRLADGRVVPVIRHLVGYRGIDGHDVAPTSYRIAGRNMGFASIEDVAPERKGTITPDDFLPGDSMPKPLPEAT